MENRKYRRDLSPGKKSWLQKRYQHHLKHSRGGFLTPKQKKRLLGLKSEHATIETDFWYRIKIGAKSALLDLQLITDMANDEQLEDIFEPLTINEYQSIDQGKITRADLKRLVDNILWPGKTRIEQEEYWKYKLAVDLLNSTLNYLSSKTTFQNKLYRRHIEEVRDLFDPHRDSTLSGFAS